MNITKIILCSTLFILSSCTLGVRELKVDFPDEAKFKLSDSTSSKTIIQAEKDVSITLEWVGNAYSVSTAKNLIGFTNRFVIPYTKKTALLNIKIENKSNKIIDFSLNNISLNTSPTNLELKPLTIEFFKNRWPSFAVKSQDMLIDQATAIGEVIRTLIKDRLISPNSTYEGYLAFSRLPETTTDIDLNLKIKLDTEYKDLSFKFVKNENK